MKVFKAIFTILLCTASARAAVWEGFELGATLWNTSEEGGRIQSAINRDVASEGAYSFGGRVEIPTLNGDPKAGFFYANEADLSQIQQFGFDIYNGTQVEWTAKLVLQTGSNWGWNEAPPWTLKPGWNRNLVVDLTKPVFEGRMLSSPELVAKTSILLIPSQPTQGALYLDNVRVAGPGAAALVPERIAGAREQLVDSFEGSSSAWKPTFGIGIRTEPDPEHATHGKQGLKWVAVSKDAEQNGIFAIEREVDLAKVQSVVLDVYNPGPLGILSFAVAYGDNWDFAASPAVRLKHGWNPNVTFGLRSKTFKSQSSNWKNNGALPSNVVRRFGFEWSPGDTGRLSLTIDRLRFREAGDTATKALAPEPELKGVLQPLFVSGAGLPVKPRDDYSAARSAVFSNAWTLAGEGPSLALRWDASAKDQSGDFEWTESPDFRGVKAIQVDAYNPGAQSVDVALAVQVGTNSEWLESRPLRLAPGWNHGLQLGLDGPAFKSAATQWAYGASLPGRGPSSIRTAYWHVVAPAPGEGTVYLAKVDVLRSSWLPGNSVLLGMNGSSRFEFAMDPVSWEIWDSGAGEGSFEKGVSGWKGENSGPGGASVVSVEEGRASAGQKSLRVDFRGSGQDKAVALYEATGAPAIPDLSQVKRLRFDVFNPGAPLAVGVAFVVGTNNTWVESAPQALHSGWNRDVTFDLEAPMWKSVASGSSTVPGATEILGYFPAASRGAGQVNKLNILFHGARYGSVWLDSVQFGKTGGTSVTRHELDLGLNLGAGPLELKIGGKAVQKLAGGDYDFLPGASHVGLKGAGQELVLSWSEPLPAFDDVLQVFSGRRGLNDADGGYARISNDNWTALRWKGSLSGMQLYSFGALPNGPAPYSFGGQALGGVRVKAASPGGSYLGGAILHQRLGHDAGAAVMTDRVEQSSQIMEVDGEARLPWGFRAGAGVGRSDWAQAPVERMVLTDERGLPLLYSRPLTGSAQALGVKGGWSGRWLDVNGAYSDVADGFDTNQSDTLYLAKKIEAKGTLKMDALPGIREAALPEGWGHGLLRGMNSSLEYLTHDSVDQSYLSKTYTLRFENSRNESVGYVVVVAAKQEDKPATAASTASAIKSQTQKLIGRFGLWDGAALQPGLRLVSRDLGAATITDTIYGVEATQAFLRHFTLSGAFAARELAGSGGLTGYSVNGYTARLAWQPHEKAKLEFWLGRDPLGEEFEPGWPVADETMGLSVEANF